MAVDIDVMDANSSHCYGCEDSLGQIKDHCVDTDCALDSCVGSCSVAFYYNPSAIVFPPVRVNAFGYRNITQFQSMFATPLYRRPIT